MSTTRLTLIFPVYNAAPFLRDSLSVLGQWLRIHPEADCIFVNDGSTDESMAILEEAKKDFPQTFQIIDMGANKGKGAAVRAGMRLATGDLIAFTDIDLPYGLPIFDAMRAVMDEDPNLSFLYGSRSHADSRFKGYGALRHVGRRFFSLAIRTMVITDTSDTQCGIKMFRKDFADVVAHRSVIDRFAFDIELFVIAKVNHFHAMDFPVRLLRHRESSVRIVKDTITMLKDMRRIRERIRSGAYSSSA
ncbi:glycosyltransferase [Patescibacteria group bacterium]|nr:glycosyltransferase [Patescibacteria group bacterium]